MNDNIITTGDGVLSHLTSDTPSEPTTISLELLQEVIEDITSVRNSESEEEESPLTEEEINILEQAVEEAHQEIPVNSSSLLVDEATSRFSSAIWYENIQKKVIILAGVGGIGRFGNLVNF